MQYNTTLYIVQKSKTKIMADNYIEKQRADYEARKAAWEKEKKYGVRKTTTKKASSEPKSKK